MSRRHIIIAAALAACAHAFAQRTYSPNFSVGGRAGLTMSSVAFTPGVSQKMADGFTFGAVVRYTEEKCVGVIGELNVAQRGWAESYDPGEPWQYRQTLTYISVPVLTHIFFGPRKFKCVINLGPEVSFLIGKSVSSNFNYMSPPADYPADRRTEQMQMPVTQKVDYGITAGLGAEWHISRRHSVVVEARYYFGLGNLFPSAKKDVFSASRPTSIEVTAGYMFRVK